MSDDFRWIGSVSTGAPITVDDARQLLTYSRDSSERLTGVFGQETEIIDWAERTGYTVVGMFRDVAAHSLSPAEERPAFRAALNAIREGKADGMACVRLDRLGRDFQTQDGAANAVWEAGGRLFSTDGEEWNEWTPDRPGSPSWRLRRDYARMAEEERLALLAKLQKGRRQKIARGGYGGGSRFHRRYGMELVPIQGRLEYRPVPAEQAVIRRIQDFCSGGRGYEAMAKTLNSEGVPAPSSTRWNRKTIRDLAQRGPDQLVAVQPELRELSPVEWRIRAVG